MPVVNIILQDLDKVDANVMVFGFSRAYRRLVSLVGKASVCCAGGSGSIPGGTNTQGLKIIEENVLPLL